MWDTRADLDLHVIDPTGLEVYHGQPYGTGGGELDVDANSRCGGSDIRAENIVWPPGLAPSGRYTVRVNHWSACGASATRYILGVVNGRSLQTFDGTLTGPGTGGGLGAGTTVTTFQK